MNGSQRIDATVGFKTIIILCYDALERGIDTLKCLKIQTRRLTSSNG